MFYLITATLNAPLLVRVYAKDRFNLSALQQCRVKRQNHFKKSIQPERYSHRGQSILWSPVAAEIALMQPKWKMEWTIAL